MIPAVGCGVDNLDTLKSTETVDMSNSRLEVFENVTALDYALPLPRQDITCSSRLETCFGILDSQQRMRVVVDVICQNKQIKIQSPITLILERQTNPLSSQGTIADGGGLDGRTVAELLGDDLRRRPFADVEPAETDSSVDSKTETERFMLRLPGNVTVSYGVSSPDWILDVAHGDGPSRQVVRRRFMNDNDTLDASIERWVEEKSS